MTPDRFRECLDLLDWAGPGEGNQRGLARLLGMDDRQVRRWAAGARIPDHVAEWMERVAAFHAANPPPDKPGRS
jgi:hypothetical protein